MVYHLYEWSYYTLLGILVEKIEVGQIIKKICKLVHAQFNTQIQVFKINNGIGFFNKIMNLTPRKVHDSIANAEMI